ncbi:hypothetical protein [Stappia sp. ES.058]|uniref:hypothetical protein n=1 Tax=Stappia sp. ES.058 TaxID=1881061 RepID=UPI00087D2CE0|nr:hypothetical protein [Stappia sp. ES.058]SDU07749.1 hypothetical protein SAMN05428979_1497 [Stappia sp. ES.058]
MSLSASSKVAFFLALSAWLVISAQGSPKSGAIENLHARTAGLNSEALRRDVVELARLARRHVETEGLVVALDEFKRKPWKRQANGLHIWGVTMSGLSWYDVGHPDLVGIDVRNITDIEGRYWARLARESAEGSGARVFSLLFPHPETELSARSLHTCFLLKDGQRILCAGGFEDVPR